MPVIKFGSTINNVSLDCLQNLLRVSKDKVLIDLSGVNLKGIYSKSNYNKLLEYKDVSSMESSDKDYLFDLYYFKLYQLLSFLLSENECLLDATVTRDKADTK